MYRLPKKLKKTRKKTKKLEKEVVTKVPIGEKHLTEVGFEPTPEDQCLKLAP